MALKHAVGVAAVMVATVSHGVSVGADPPFVNHFKGHGAQALLTDCTLGLPDGAECLAVDVFVSDERYQERGTKWPLELMDVVVYDVVIDSAAPDGFVAIPAAIGFTTEVDLVVARDLSSASASADVPLVLCELDAEGDPVCEDPGGSMSIEVAWTATGKRQTTTFRDRGTDGSIAFAFRAVDVFRTATASGVVDGQPLPTIPLFPPALFSTNNGVVERTLT